MKLLLPMDREDTQEAQLVPIAEAVSWAIVELEEGQVVEVTFHANGAEAMEAWPDAVVVTGNFEPVMEYIEQQMMVLVAPMQRSVDEIVEAFLFKELHELSS